MAEAPAATVTLYGRDEKPVEVPAAQAAALLRSGQFGLPEGATVPMATAEGGWEQVDAATAVQRAQSYTARIGSAQDVHDTAREKEFSGLGMKALAAGSGVVDSLGLGFGDAALVKGGEMLGHGDDVRAFLQDADRFAGGSRLAGKVGGFLLPALASGGASGAAQGAGRGLVGGAARAITAPARALTALGEGAGGLVARGVAEAGAPGVGRFLAPMVSQGLELGVYGAGDAASRLVVRDPQADGEALAGAMGQGFLHGAAMGAGFGAGIGALGAGASFVGGKVSGAVDRAGTRLGEFLDTGVSKLRGLEAKASEAAPELLGRGAELVGQGLDRATGLAEQVTGRTAPALAEGAGLAGRADRLFRTAVDVDKAAVETTLRSTGGTQRTLTEAAALPSPVKERLVAQIDKYGEKMGKPGKTLDFAEQAEAAALTKREAGGRVGEVLDKIEEASGGAGFTPIPAIRMARKEVVEPLRKIAGKGPIADKVEGYLGELQKIAEEGPMGFKDFHAQRSGLDDLIYAAQVARDTPAIKAMKRVRAIMEESFEASVSMAGKRAESAVMAEYKAAKAEYRAAAMGEKLTKDGAKRALGNRTYGLSEQLGMGMGIVAGGGGLTGMAMGAAGAVVNRAVKQGGDQVAAAILRQVAAGKPLAEAVADVTRRNVSDHVGRFFDAVREPATKLVEQGRARAKAVLGEVREGAERAVAGAKEGARQAKEVAAGAARAAGRVAKRAGGEGLVVERQRAADEFEQRRKALASYKAAGPARVDQVAQQFAASGVPEATARAAAATAAKGADYLASKLPAVPQRGRTLQPELSRARPSPDEIEDWLHRARVVDDPSVVLKSLGQGQLRAEEIETLREVYPGYYQAIRDEVAAQVHQLTEEGIELPRRQELLLARLFPDIETDPTNEGSFIAALQAPPPAPPPGLAPSARRPIRVSHLYDLETHAR